MDSKFEHYSCSDRILNPRLIANKQRRRRLIYHWRWPPIVYSLFTHFPNHSELCLLDVRDYIVPWLITIYAHIWQWKQWTQEEATSYFRLCSKKNPSIFLFWKKKPLSTFFRVGLQNGLNQSYWIRNYMGS